MTPRTIQPVVAAAGFLYEVFVSRFKREMIQPVITVQTKGRKNACAWFWANRWQNGEPCPIPEINLCAAHISDGMMELTNSVLLEIVHYANWLVGVRDCSSIKYHNRHFKDR